MKLFFSILFARYFRRPGLQLRTFRGYRNDHVVQLQGYVVKQIPYHSTPSKKSFWRNIIQMLYRYLGKGVAQASVEVNFMGKTKAVKTDEQGKFMLTLNSLTPSPNATAYWYPVEITLQSTEKGPITENGEILYPHNYTYGIISDIDDTILLSYSTRPFRKIWTMLMNNAFTRKTFEHAASFYQQLHSNGPSNHHNPFFYISSSEGNLYDMLVNFCDHYNFPKGVLLLRQPRFGIKDWFIPRKKDHTHKLHKIYHVMDTYPDMKFVLVGDNGQQDAYLYADVANKHPERILAIYLREIVPSRVELIQQVAELLPVEMIQVKNFKEAEQHAREKGIID